MDDDLLIFKTQHHLQPKFRRYVQNIVLFIAHAHEELFKWQNFFPFASGLGNVMTVLLCYEIIHRIDNQFAELTNCEV
jgi:hypothetical protein